MCALLFKRQQFLKVTVILGFGRASVPHGKFVDEKFSFSIYNGFVSDSNFNFNWPCTILWLLIFSYQKYFTDDISVIYLTKYVFNNTI